MRGGECLVHRLCASNDARLRLTLPFLAVVAYRWRHQAQRHAEVAQSVGAGGRGGCLGWLVGNISAAALPEIIPLVTQLMVKHTMTGDEVFIQQEREREEQATRGRYRSGKGFDGGGGRGRGGRGGRRRW